jgi:hypothetical protein
MIRAGGPGIDGGRGVAAVVWRPCCGRVAPPSGFREAGRSLGLAPPVALAAGRPPRPRILVVVAAAPSRSQAAAHRVPADPGCVEAGRPPQPHRAVADIRRANGSLGPMGLGREPPRQDALWGARQRPPDGPTVVSDARDEYEMAGGDARTGWTPPGGCQPCTGRIRDILCPRPDAWAVPMVVSHAPGECEIRSAAVADGTHSPHASVITRRAFSRARHAGDAYLTRAGLGLPSAAARRMHRANGCEHRVGGRALPRPAPLGACTGRMDAKVRTAVERLLVPERRSAAHAPSAWMRTAGSPSRRSPCAIAGACTESMDATTG